MENKYFYIAIFTKIMFYFLFSIKSGFKIWLWSQEVKSVFLFVTILIFTLVYFFYLFDKNEIK